MLLEPFRLQILSNFAERGVPGTVDELAAQQAMGRDAVQEGLRRLADERHVVLDPAGGIAMAHPFSSTPLGFAVMGSRTLWWGGCAWDSFALPHLLPSEHEVLVSTRCPGCGRALAWNVDDRSAPIGGEVAHFLVPVATMWDDVTHTCGNQRIFCDASCVERWLEVTGHARGYVMDLGTLWRLASRWYEGRLDAGYERRDPSTAAAYFEEVGLEGPFWGLPAR